MHSKEEGANSGAGTSGQGIVPMETEEGVPPRALEIPNLFLPINVCFLSYLVFRKFLQGCNQL
jgi:hypothetical protein